MAQAGEAGDKRIGSHNPTITTNEGQLDGKDSSANEFYADESGRADGDEEADIERIEKVYR